MGQFRLIWAHFDPFSAILAHLDPFWTNKSPLGTIYANCFVNIWKDGPFWPICRFRMVKIWIHQNTFFSWFFTWRVLIMVYYIIKLILEFQFDLQNPLKQPKMWIFEKWKIIVSHFWPKLWHFSAQRWSKTTYSNVFG